MSDDPDDLKFSQESLSLLFTGGATGVDLEHHIPITSSFGDSPTLPYLRDRLPRLASEQSLFSSGQQSMYSSASELNVESLPMVTPVNPPDLEILTDQLPGAYCFNLKFEEKDVYPKNFPHCYSRQKNTLIVKDNLPIPFTFTSNYSMRDLRVNIVAVFTLKDNFHQAVMPCNNHLGSSQGLNKQFIACSNSSCMDSIDQERHHLILPLNHCRDLSGNGTEITENLYFTCRSSCSVKSGNRGINHKALSLICQLETLDGVVLGRRVVSLKVSVSPGRDIETLLKQNRARKRSRATSEAKSPTAAISGNSSPTTVSSKKLKTKAVKGAGKYTVVCQHRRTLKLITAIAQHSGFLDDTYIGTDPVSQQSVATQENGSQPEQYSLEGWLSRYGVEGYVNQLEQAGFGSPDKFQCLTDEDLDNLGIVDRCHRMTLLHAAKRILLRGINNIVKNS